MSVAMSFVPLLERSRTMAGPGTGDVDPTTAPVPRRAAPRPAAPRETTPRPARGRHRAPPRGLRAAPRHSRPARPPARVPLRPRALVPTPAFVVATLVLVAGAVALRAWHQTSAYEVFLDEIQYSDVGNSFAAGVGPQLFGEPFYLHPPLFFTLLGAVIPEPVDHMTVGFVLSLRPVMLGFGALNTLLVVAVARRAVGQGAALLAGAVYALDPFVIRFDSRVMLEAPMMLGVLAGMFALLSAVATRDLTTRRLLLAATGVAWGLALITKTTSGLVTGLPLVIMFLLGWGLRRRETLGVVALQVGVYLVYLGWVVVDGHAGAWFDQTLAGTFRALGLIKETGFSSANAPSFTSRIVANLGVFGSSYLLIAVACTAGGLLLLRHRRNLRADAQWSLARPGDEFRLVLCWFAGVLAGIVYTGGLGEVEEQTFYLLAVPCAVVLAVLVRLTSAVRLAPRILLAAGLVLALGASGAAWWQVHSRPDDSYRRVIGHLYRHVPQSQQIALGEQTAQFVTPGYGVHKFTSIDDARAAGARYGLVSTQLTALGLAPAPQSLLDELARRYAVEVSANGRTSGELVLYDLNRPLDGSPPVVPGAGK